jgi:hypothetical protein
MSGHLPGIKENASPAPADEAGGTAPARRSLGAPRPALALFLAFLGFYLLTASGHFYAVDEETLYVQTESIVERGTIAVPRGAWGMVLSLGSREGDGPAYSIFPPGQSVAAVPFYLIGRALTPLFPAGQRGFVLRFAVGLLNPLVTAATVALLYALARRLGYRGAVAAGLAICYGVATLGWGYSRTFFAEPLTALLLLASFYALRRATEVERPNWRWLAGAGALAALSIPVKPHAALALPVLGFYLLGRTFARRDARRVVAPALLWGAGVAAVLLPYVAINVRVFGSPIGAYSSGPIDNFTNPFLTGLYGLTVSPGRGLLWYAPPLGLALAGWWPFFRRHRAEALAVAGVLAAHLAYYSGHYEWAGGGAWGPRYLLIALPLAVLPLVAWLEGLRAQPLRAALTVAVVAGGILVQLVGNAVNFDYYLGGPVDANTRYFSPKHSPILWHARYLRARVAEWRDWAVTPPDSATLRAGFAERESEGHRAIFPRWTTGAGEIAIKPAAAAALTVKLTLFDHRPPALRDQPAILVNGTPLPDDAVTRRLITADGEGQTLEFTLAAEAVRDGRALVTLSSGTWNPRAAGQGDRDETLGLFVHNVEIWRDGTPLVVRDKPARLRIEPMPDTPRWRFWWFNNDHTRHHLVDWWAWYAAVAGFAPQTTRLWIGGYATISGAILLAGLALGWRSLPAGLLHRPQHRRKRRAAQFRPAAATRAVSPRRAEPRP